MIIDKMYERSAGTEIGRRLANARALGSNPNLQNATYNWRQLDYPDEQRDDQYVKLIRTIRSAWDE
jgi:hypothetical protein